MDPSEVTKAVFDFLRSGVAVHKRRVQERRGSGPEENLSDCGHANWNHERNWCDDCGVTKAELVAAMGGE